MICAGIREQESPDYTHVWRPSDCKLAIENPDNVQFTDDCTCIVCKRASREAEGLANREAYLARGEAKRKQVLQRSQTNKADAQDAIDSSDSQTDERPWYDPGSFTYSSMDCQSGRNCRRDDGMSLYQEYS